MDKTNVKSTRYILACDKDLSRPAPGAVAVVAQTHIYVPTFE